MDEKELTPSQPSWFDVLKNLAFIAVAIGVAYFVTVIVGIDNIREKAAVAGIFGPFIIIFLKAMTIVVVPLGGMPLYPIAGAIWGFWQGLGITLVGDIIGSTIAFYLSRSFGRSILKFFMSRQNLPMVEKLVAKFGETSSFIRARFFFSGFMELFAYAAGLTKISYPIFIIIHIGFHSIVAALFVAFGDLLVSGNIKAVVIAGLTSTLLALSGVWWFHADLERSA